MNSNLTVRIDQHIKELASANAKQLGLDLSTIIRMLLTQLAAKALSLKGW